MFRKFQNQGIDTKKQLNKSGDQQCLQVVEDSVDQEEGAP